MEAMACGTPVVATRVGGIAELVDGAGLLAAPGEPGLVARELDRLRDARLRASLGRLGRTRVEREFSAASGGRQLVASARSYVS
jgi:glycosyltransferase involved in cell wall biosynthesis